MPINPAYIAAAGTLLGGAGSVVGALKGSGGGSGDLERKIMRNPMMYLMKDAKQYGIHPLAALGLNPSMPQTPKQVGTDYDRLGKGLQQMLGAFNPRKKEMSDLLIEQEKAKLENMNLRNVGLRKDISATSNPTPIFSTALDQYYGIPGQAQAVNYKPAEVTMSEKPGYVAGRHPLMKEYIHPSGTRFTGMEDKASEAAENDWFFKGQYFVKRMGDYVKGVAASYPAAYPQLRKFSFIRDRMRFLQKERPQAPKGYEYRYNPLMGYWTLRKRQFGQTHILDLIKLRKPQYRGKTVNWK